MMMSVHFAFDIVESSMRIMVDGDDISCGLLQRSTKGTPELVIRLRDSKAWSIGFGKPFAVGDA